jgi:hypothetical protein
VQQREDQIFLKFNNKYLRSKGDFGKEKSNVYFNETDAQRPVLRKSLKIRVSSVSCLVVKVYSEQGIVDLLNILVMCITKNQK